MCTTDDVNTDSCGENTNFLVDHGCMAIADDQRHDETDDIETTAEKDEDTVRINPMTWLQQGWTQV